MFKAKRQYKKLNKSRTTYISSRERKDAPTVHWPIKQGKEESQSEHEVKAKENKTKKTSVMQCNRRQPVFALLFRDSKNIKRLLATRESKILKGSKIFDGGSFCFVDVR